MEEQKINSPFESGQGTQENKVEQYQETIKSDENLVSHAEAAATIATQVEYAGFWVRFAAMIVDGLILIVPSIVVSAIFGKNLGFILQYVLMWTYAIYMLNTKQATFGKMAVGLKVTTVDGQVASIGKLALREIIGKTILNALTLGIGYVMVAFTEKKQGLHDMIAGTVVVYDPTRKRRGWLVVLGIVLALIVPIAGILAGVILVSMNSAKQKAQDSAVKVTISAVMPSALLYNDDNGTFKGFELDKKFNIIECSGRPILRISSDGKNIAIFAKSCSDDKKYFCTDKDGLVEVSENYAKAENSSCK